MSNNPSPSELDIDWLLAASESIPNFGVLSEYEEDKFVERVGTNLCKVNEHEARKMALQSLLDDRGK